MTKTFAMSTLPNVPEERRETLLRVKRSAKKAGHKAVLWLDHQGLHVKGSAEMFKAVASALPAP